MCSLLTLSENIAGAKVFFFQQLSMESGLYERIRERGMARSRDHMNSVASQTLAESRVSQVQFLRFQRTRQY